MIPNLVDAGSFAAALQQGSAASYRPAQPRSSPNVSMIRGIGVADLVRLPAVGSARGSASCDIAICEIVQCARYLGSVANTSSILFDGSSCFPSLTV